jgi:hypothetical protein
MVKSDCLPSAVVEWYDHESPTRKGKKSGGGSFGFWAEDEPAGASRQSATRAGAKTRNAFMGDSFSRANRRRRGRAAGIVARGSGQ